LKLSAIIHHQAMTTLGGANQILWLNYLNIFLWS